MFLEKKLVLWYTEDVNYYFMLSNKLCTLQMFCLLSKIMESIFWWNQYFGATVVLMECVNRLI
jgi:hypothetical protein